MTVENLNIFVANTLANAEKVNENFEILRVANNSTENKIGDLGALTTTQKSNVVAAINNSLEIMTGMCNSIILPGVIIATVLNSAPSGYLLCNGAAISRTTYAALFAAIGTTYGAGNGDTTFNIPDFRGYFLRGYLNGTSNAIGAAQSGGLPNITGTMTNAYRGNVTGAFYYNGQSSDGGDDHTNNHVGFNASRCNSLYGAANEVRPINHAVNFCIKY